ncbi:RagB/SusD family nutrient uptake outer membrane protein [Desertivirga arenae]|uniref:RagB/SusD family nutrient uptake outer membrane protein n=1 Tax=Desertivirga arenae TaxID=2810309 RepID=UPI001A97AB3D|nr:RagB/SusD family nutrient uptake outer membrane protein [Pedobacter sp. SYSU D00823]
MKRNLKSLVKGVLFVSLTLSTLSCKKMFDLEPEDALPAEMAYQSVYDADAAIMGIYGKFTSLADRYVVLNELRGDLEDITLNADKYLREINEHNVSQDNPWANPKPWYEVIINCNDAMRNFDVMLNNKRLTQDEYKVRYSEVAALRTWIYLQLGIQYGEVYYVTDPLVSISDINDINKFPKLNLPTLISTLTDFAEKLPSKDPIPSGNSLRITLDSYNTEKVFINKTMLLGDLHLWNGEYALAAKYYKILMEYGSVLDPTGLQREYYASFNVGGNPHDLGGNDWFRIFNQGYSERAQNHENFWMIPLDIKFSPGNPFVNLFAPSTDKYKIKPSLLAVKNWNDQLRSNSDAALNGQPGDLNRGGLGKSYDVAAGLPYVNKLIPGFNSSSPFTTSNGKWILYRTALLHLRMAETANRDGIDKLAYALVNLGIREAYTPKLRPLPTDVTNIMISTDAANKNPDYVFYARQGEIPRYRDKYSYNVGIRGRVGLVPVTVDSSAFFDMSNKGRENKPLLPGTTRAGLTVAMENIIINEAALELAFEGNRWQDLVRIALRREKDQPGKGREFLRNTIAKKFQEANQPVPAGVEKLSADVKNWFLPFKWQ